MTSAALELLTGPLSPGKAKRMADPMTGVVTIGIPVTVADMLDRSAEEFAAHLAARITGDRDADLLGDVTPEPVVVADGRVVLRVRAYAHDWISEYICREADCYLRSDDGDSYDGYCPTHADQHYSEDED